jgi:hypothetical protein
MLAASLWAAFFVVFALYRMRVQQSGGAKDRGALIMTALAGGVALVSGALDSWISAAVMVAAWFVLPVVAKPLMAAIAGQPSKKAKAGAPTSEQGLRMGRLNRGELSLADFFNEGRQDDQATQQRLEALAARRDIADVLSKNKVSKAAFFDLREQLATVPELQWDILGAPKDLERLILLVAKSKSPAEIGNTFRGSRRR